MAKKEYKKPLVYVQKPKSEKKQYKSPKATIYKAERPPKAKKSSGSKHGFRVGATTTVMGLISLLLMIGLLASVFFAYDNSNLENGESFVFFSPSKYLRTLSQQDIYIKGDSYEVRIEYEKKWYQIDGKYWGYLDIGDISIKSITFVNEFAINNPDVTFKFYVNGEHYNSVSYALQGPGLEVEYIRYVHLPDTILTIGKMPDFEKVTDTWGAVGSTENVFTALGTTAQFVSDYTRYIANILKVTLPWNSVVSSNDIPDDGVVISIPWRNE